MTAAFWILFGWAALMLAYVLWVAWQDSRRLSPFHLPFLQGRVGVNHHTSGGHI